MRKRALFIGAVALVLVVGVVGIILANANSGGGQNQAGGQTGGSSQTSQQNSGGGGDQTSANPPKSGTQTSTPPPHAQSTGTIQFSDGGQFMVTFYSNATKNPMAAWNQLTTLGRYYYNNSEQRFAEYWSQQGQVYTGHISSVTKNPDGSSLNVPVPLTYGSGQSTTIEATVVQTAAGLQVDSNTMINGTSLPNDNGGANSQ